MTKIVLRGNVTDLFCDQNEGGHFCAKSSANRQKVATKLLKLAIAAVLIM